MLLQGFRVTVRDGVTAAITATHKSNLVGVAFRRASDGQPITDALVTDVVVAGASRLNKPKSHMFVGGSVPAEVLTELLCRWRNAVIVMPGETIEVLTTKVANGDIALLTLEALMGEP